MVPQEGRDALEAVSHQIAKVMFGKNNEIEQMLIAMLCGGHILLEDVPGVGKTLMAKALAQTLGCSMRRIQFTPDLLPSDLLGVSIWNSRDMAFEFKPGPIHTQVVVADELNRASAKTQAALLEAMEEGQVTVDGATHFLPNPFLVIATQNPLGHEGTYRLSDAQADRFLMRLRLGYPELQDEMRLLRGHTARHDISQVEQVLTPDAWVSLQRHASQLYVDDRLIEYIVRVVRETRVDQGIEKPASPRASQALLRAAQAKALLEGRDYVICDDIKSLACAVLSHRIRMKPELLYQGITEEDAVRGILTRVPVPLLVHASGQ